MDIREKLAKGMEHSLFLVRNAAPIKTANLRYNGVRLESTGEGIWKLFVDEGIAPYMPYTNEIWDIKIIEQGIFKKGKKRAVVRTWQNPNEGWWNDAIELVISYLASYLGGSLSKGGN